MVIFGVTENARPFDHVFCNQTRRVDVDMLWINMPASTSPELPFGGLKDSDYGLEGGPEALESYLNVIPVVINNR